MVHSSQGCEPWFHAAWIKLSGLVFQKGSWRRLWSLWWVGMNYIKFQGYPKKRGFLCSWRYQLSCIQIMYGSSWAAVSISLQKIDGMPWAVTAKSHPWRKPAWCKCVMKSPTNINSVHSVQPLQTNRTNSSYRHCLVFQRRRWGDLLMRWTHCLKFSSMIFACETVSWVFVWKQAMCLHNGRCHWHPSWIPGLLWYFIS